MRCLGVLVLVLVRCVRAQIAEEGHVVDGRDVAFVCAANAHVAGPAALALLRVHEFYPSAKLFIAGSARTVAEMRRKLPVVSGLFARYNGTLDTLTVDAGRSKFLAAIAKLRTADGKIRAFLQKGPWPLEMFFWVVVPQLLEKRGIRYTVAMDPDVMAMDGRLLGELRGVAGIGVVRLFPKECYGLNTQGRLPAFVAPLLDNVTDAASPHEFSNRDGTNSGLIVFQNARMAELDLEQWATDAATACRGYLYGDQDLLNLLLGRRDIEVAYLHPRFNVQLAYPTHQRDAFMDQPWCAYGQAQFAVAAIGEAAFGASSFGHFIWTPKPWQTRADTELRNIHASLERGARPYMRFSVLASPAWINAWRDFAVRLLGASDYEALFRIPPDRRVVEFSILAVGPGSVYKCIGADTHLLNQPITSCGVPRPENDTDYPDEWPNWAAVAAAVKPVARVAPEGAGAAAPAHAPA